MDGLNQMSQLTGITRKEQAQAIEAFNTALMNQKTTTIQIQARYDEKQKKYKRVKIKSEASRDKVPALQTKNFELQEVNGKLPETVIQLQYEK
jgi:hypothetical protein